MTGLHIAKSSKSMYYSRSVQVNVGTLLFFSKLGPSYFLNKDGTLMY